MEGPSYCAFSITLFFLTPPNKAGIIKSSSGATHRTVLPVSSAPSGVIMGVDLSSTPPSPCLWAVGTGLLHWVWQPSHNIVQGRSLSFSCCLNVVWQMDSICRESGGLTLPLTLSLSLSLFFSFSGHFLPAPQTFQGGEICIKLTLSNRASELPDPCLLSNQSFVFFLAFQPKPYWIQRLQQLPVIFQPAAPASTGAAAANRERCVSPLSPIWTRMH